MTEFNIAFRPRAPDERNVFRKPICVLGFSVRRRPGRKPSCFSYIHLSPALNNRWGIMSTINFIVFLPSRITLWCSQKDPSHSEQLDSTINSYQSLRVCSLTHIILKFRTRYTVCTRQWGRWKNPIMKIPQRQHMVQDSSIFCASPVTLCILQYLTCDYVLDIPLIFPLLVTQLIFWWCPLKVHIQKINIYEI